MESNIYNAQGKKAGSITLPESIFGHAWNASLIHQVVTSMQDNARTAVAHTKGRGEVRGGGKKPWQQKGTGRARAGSSRSPIWKGGGVTHGPLAQKVYARDIPKKMRAKALFVALSRKFKDGEIIFVDSFGFDAPKTAAAHKALIAIAKGADASPLSTKKKNAALVAVADPNANTQKSFSNIGNVECVAVRNINPVEGLKYKYLIIETPEASRAIIATRDKAKATKKSMALFSSKKKTEAKAEKPAKAKKSTEVAVKAVATSTNNAGLSDVLRALRITEKASLVSDHGVFVFNVAEDATKNSIMKAIRMVYSVTPRKVSIVTVRPKAKRNARTGRSGWSTGGKKAYVYLNKGETITIA